MVHERGCAHVAVEVDALDRSLALLEHVKVTVSIYRDSIISACMWGVSQRRECLSQRMPPPHASNTVVVMLPSAVPAPDGLPM
jgi:hypothetical protein